jgi:hypothetical protein
MVDSMDLIRKRSKNLNFIALRGQKEALKFTKKQGKAKTQNQKKLIMMIYS